MNNSAGTARGVAAWSTLGYLPVILIFAVMCMQGIATAQPVSNGDIQLNTGKEIFDAACIACHGPGGKGQPKTTLGFEPPATFPDFSDCNGSTGERMFDWRATIHEGGAGRGFSLIMPSFAEALTPEQIDKVAKYLRTLCTEPGWPPGELNMPRAMFTEKAFPESETVITTTINAKGAPGVSNEIAYEKRLSPKMQLELSIPFSFQHQDTGTWFGGLSDVAIGLKRVLYYNANTGSIFGVQGEVKFPTGNAQRGLGSGVTTFETFGSYGQLLPKQTFAQFQIGAELPTHTNDTPRALFWRGAFGRTFTQNKGYGRIWTPQFEFLADRDLEDGAKTNWDVVPQLQVSLNRRQHILASVGFDIPVNNKAQRGNQVVFYLLWDWFDGGLREGW